MFVQRALLRLHRTGLFGQPLRTFLERRTWQVEEGPGAGLKIAFPQNLDFVRGSTEPPMQACVTGHLAPGDVFYDVGANVGFFSMLGARCVGRAGYVYAFEPVAENVAAIRTNARLNAFDNVTVFEVAVDAQSGTRDLFLTEWDGGASLSRAAVPAGEPVSERQVPVVSLDDLIESKGLRPPTFVKIDVEGAELGVLNGMRKTIDRFKPLLVYEVDDGDKSSFESRHAALDRVVEELGYRVTHLNDSYANVTWYVGHSFAEPTQPAVRGLSNE